jgi:hypothetical protein
MCEHIGTTEVVPFPAVVLTSLTEVALFAIVTFHQH